AWLDQMCLGGHVAWCRLSVRRTYSSGRPDDVASSGAPDDLEPDEARADDDRPDDEGPDGDAPRAPLARAPRATPTRSAPLTLMLRRDATWLRAPAALR